MIFFLEYRIFLAFILQILDYVCRQNILEVNEWLGVEALMDCTFEKEMGKEQVN